MADQPLVLHQPLPIINIQPGESIEALPGTIWMPIPTESQDGLEYLSHLETIQICQIKEMIEAFSGWESNNKYVLKNANGEQCYYAFEKSDSCQRECSGPDRQFVINIVDNYQKEVLTISRGSACFGSACYGCCAFTGLCQQTCTISSPSMGVLGSIRQRFGFLAINFDVLDPDGNIVLQIGSSGGSCGGLELTIKPPNSDEKIGVITKEWGGLLREAFTDADTFIVNFPLDMDVKLKGVLVGAAFLVDFMLFESAGTCAYNI